jgi:DNA-binding transcriptional regulator YdaS (Cro superfamily)
MGAVASFVYSDWVARYPEFSGVSSSLAQMYFNEAALVLRNDGTSPVNDVGQQTMLLYMLTAHIAFLNPGATGQPASTAGSVGSISSATQGSVSVSYAKPAVSGSAEWFAQSKYGFAYWNAMAPYRQMRYVPGPRKTFEPPYGRPGYVPKW